MSTTTVAASNAANEEVANKAFSTSILISATRCILAYVVFPFVLPALGIASGVGPGIGLVIGPIALVSNVFSIRRFWASNHRYKWPVSVINVSIIGLVSVLLAADIAHFV